jgi:transposase
MIIVGLDWGRNNHEYVLMATNGDILQRGSVAHNADGLDELAGRIDVHVRSPQEVRVGIEMNDGALLAWLLAKGYTVFGIHPKSAQRARDIYRPSGSKDDRIDAFVLAEFVRATGDHLRPVRAASPLTQALRDLLRWRDRVVRQRTAANLRLRAVLDEWSPHLSQLCTDLARKWTLELLQAFPMANDLCEAHGNTIRAFVRRHRLRAQTYQHIDDVRQAKPMPVPEGRVGALKRRTRSLGKQIQQLSAEVQEIEQELLELIAQHPDSCIFKSLPSGGPVTIATLLALFGEDRHDAPSWEGHAARCGVAPVTVASGKSRQVRQRRAYDRTFRHALTYFALNTATTDGCWAREFYQRKRQEGTQHYVALRCLAKRWMKILHRLWKDRTLYDEQKHQANRQRHQSHAA